MQWDPKRKNVAFNPIINNKVPFRLPLKIKFRINYFEDMSTEITNRRPHLSITVPVLKFKKK